MALNPLHSLNPAVGLLQTDFFLHFSQVLAKSLFAKEDI